MNSYWDKALRKLETTKTRKLVEVLAVLAITYGITILLFNTLFFTAPVTMIQWIQWTFHIFFNGIVLPLLGFLSKRDHSKHMQLTKDIFNCVTKEIALMKELSINTHKLALRFVEKADCLNYRPKDIPKDDNPE